MKISLPRGQRVRDGSSSHKIDYFALCYDIFDLKVHQNRIIGSKVRVILLNGWILPISGVALEMVCAYSWLSRFVIVCC